MSATLNIESCREDAAKRPDLLHLPGAQTQYFSAETTSLPVDHTVAASAIHDGLFVVIELPPSREVYVQIWTT